MADAYTLTQADVDGCRRILAKLEEIDGQLGGFSVGNVQGARKSATATVHYAHGGDPFATAEAISYALESVPNLALLCKKVIAHHETHGGGGGPDAG